MASEATLKQQWNAQLSSYSVYYDSLGIWFNPLTNTVTGIGIGTTKETIEIPEQINGKDVLYIGTGAGSTSNYNYYGWLFYEAYQAYNNYRTTVANTKPYELHQYIEIAVKNIIIPSTVLEIRSQAFYYTPITTVDISAKKIGDSAFRYCSKLGGITLNEGIEEIGMTAFNYTCRDEYMDVSQEGATYSLYIPSTIKSVGDGFCNYTGLKNVLFAENDNLTALGQYSFSNCTALSKIDMSGCSLIKELPTMCFQNCKALEEVILNDNVETIGLACFYNASFFADFTLPLNLKTISKNAFASASSSHYLYLQKNVTSIDDTSFTDFNIKKIYIYKNKGSISGEPWGASTTTAPYTEIIWLGSGAEPETKTNWFYKKDGNLIPVTPYLMKNGILIKLSTLRK